MRAPGNSQAGVSAPEVVACCRDNDPEQTLEILNGSQWIQLLGEPVASDTPITHEVLDGLTQDMHVRHLRNVLVQSGALDQQGDGLEAIEPWMRSLFAGLSPRTAAVLRPYACWSVLPRARRRAARGRIATSTPRYDLVPRDAPPHDVPGVGPVARGRITR